MSRLEQLGMFAEPEPAPKPAANVTAIDLARFARTHTRSDGPATSAAAAVKAAVFAGTHCEQIAQAMRTHPGHGWTATELADITNLDRYQINRRLPDLLEAGTIRRDGSVRDNAQGNPEQCHYITTEPPA